MWQTIQIVPSHFSNKNLKIFIFFILQFAQLMYKQLKEAVYRYHVHWLLRPEIKFTWFCGFVMMLVFHYIGKCFNRTLFNTSQINTLTTNIIVGVISSISEVLTLLQSDKPNKLQFFYCIYESQNLSVVVANWKICFSMHYSKWV